MKDDYTPIEASTTEPQLLDGKWLSTQDLAGKLTVDASTIRRWRTAKPLQGPPFVPLSDRVVVYNSIDVERWLASRRIDPELAA
jgi:predicted DNA-binding transcriptional regulator AlpA